MQVTVVDRARMDTLYGQPRFPGVIRRTVEINDKCPSCGGPRGKPQKARYHEWGEFYYVDNWTNPCGHLDRYSDVLQEAREIEERRALDGCVRCNQWDRDEDGRLMCCCPWDRYLEFHPELKQASPS